jgi:hypothetical protein
MYQPPIDNLLTVDINHLCPEETSKLQEEYLVT